jgi:tRNA-dihydrouridine synthase 3
VCDRGAGSALLLKPKRIEEIARAAERSMSLPLTLKTRKGYFDDQDVTHTFVSSIRSWGPIALTLHGRTRQQRYSRQADWQYIEKCAEVGLHYW